MTRRAYLYFILTFILGVLVGAAGTYFYAWHSGHWHRPFSRARVVQHLRHDLNLSDTQTQQVDQILADSGKKFQEIQKSMDPQFQALREDTRNRIRQILTPEQVTKFDEIVRRIDEMHKRRGPQ